LENKQETGVHFKRWHSLKDALASKSTASLETSQKFSLDCFFLQKLAIIERGCFPFCKTAFWGNICQVSGKLESCLKKFSAALTNA